jgi:spermidine synthase
MKPTHSTRTENQHENLLELSEQFPVGTGRLLVMEPPNSSAGALRDQLMSGSYKKPFVQESGRHRSLHFGLAYVQSTMYLDNPTALCLRYTKKMMGALLFQPLPRQITLIGLGGGSLAKYCYRHLPDSNITVIEIDPNVIALRKHFMVPDDSPRFQVIADDGLHHLETCMTPVDILMVDAYDEYGIADSISGQSFVDSAFQRLDTNGILVMNLAGDRTPYEVLIGRIRHTFGQQACVIPVGIDGNNVLFAFKSTCFVPDWPSIRKHAKTLSRQLALDFHFMLQFFKFCTSKDHFSKLADK